MVYTTFPTLILTLIIFGIIGLYQLNTDTAIDTGFIKKGLESSFHITPWLLSVPVLLIIIIIKKVPPIPAMLGGVVLGVIFALIFQPDLLDQLIAQEKFHNTYQLIIQAVGSRMTLSTGVSEVDELLTTGGMEGMLDTVWLIIAALTFGGVMEASGSLKRVGEAFMHFIYNDTSLVSTTILTCKMCIRDSLRDEHLWDYFFSTLHVLWRTLKNEIHHKSCYQAFIQLVTIRKNPTIRQLVREVPFSVRMARKLKIQKTALWLLLRL